MKETASGWILCADERLGCLLKNELTYPGISAVTSPEPPPPSASLCILLWDGDLLPALDGVACAEACGCPLLVFAREPLTLPVGRTKVIFLRRPFALTDLIRALRQLPEDTPVPAVIPTEDRDARNKAAAPPALSAQNGQITVGEHTVALTEAEWAIFSLLHDRRGEAVAREELSSLLEGGGNSVEVYICRLRAKIEKPLGRRMIHTVRGVGYRWDVSE